MSFAAQFLAFSGFINFATSLFLGMLLLSKSFHIKANRYFGYFCLVVAYWSLFYGIQFSTKDPIMSMYLLRTDMIGSFFIPVLYFHFIVHFTKKRIPAWVIPFNYLFAIFALAIVYTPLYANGERLVMGFLWLKPGPLFHLVTLHFPVLVSVSLWFLLDTYRRTLDKSLKQQMRIVFVGCLIGYVGGSLNYAFWYRIPILPMTTILVSVYVIMVTYAILKYQLLDVKIIVKNSLIYSGLAFAVTMVYFSIIYICERYVRGIIGYESTIASLATTIIVAIFFIPFKNFIQFLMEKFIFNATYAQITQENENLKQQVMIAERYKAFAQITNSLADALRDPITVLKTYSQYLPQRVNDKEFMQKFTTVLKIEIDKIEDMVNTLSKYSAPEPLALNKNDIFVTISDVLKGMEAECDALKVSLHKYYEDKASLWFLFDRRQIAQALVHIIQYMNKTMPRGGQIWIGCEQVKNELKIFIKDTGKAIPPDQLDKIFDPFYRYKEENRGLELSIAFSIIESHGGKITVDSQPDAGNEFIIQLPIRNNLAA